jgi:tetratricopeptide (TPR) repeat protein
MGAGLGRSADADAARRKLLQSAIAARIGRYENTRDSAAILESEVTDQARQLTQLLHDSDGDVTSRLVLGALYSHRSALLPANRGQQDAQTAATMYISAFVAADGSGPLTKLLASTLAAPVSALLVQALMSDDLGLITTASELSRHMASSPVEFADRAAYLAGLGALSRAQFEHTGSLGDLDEAITSFQTLADATGPSEPGLDGYLTSLVGVLATRYERTGELADLDRLIVCLRRRLEATPAGHPERVERMLHVGGFLESRFARTRQQSDLDELVFRFRQLVTTAPVSHPERVRWLITLSGALGERSNWTGSLADLEEAVEVAGEVVRLTPHQHPQRGQRLSNLATALADRSKRTGNLEDLNEAVATFRAALAAIPTGSPDRAAIQSNFGTVLASRAERTASQSDSYEAVRLGRVAATGRTDRADRAGRLTNLGNTLMQRYAQTNARRDLAKAVRIHTKAVRVAAATGDSQLRATTLNNLGKSLQARFERTAKRSDLDATVNVLGEVLGLDVAPAIRVEAAQVAAFLLAPTEPARAARLFERAVRLLPTVAPRSLPRPDQQHAVGRFAWLAGDAAAMALADPTLPAKERAASALQLLEMGRGVLIGQALQVRGDLIALAERDPDLATRFTELRDLLDVSPDTAGTGRSFDSVGVVCESGRNTPDRPRLARELDEVLRRIRAMDEFASFGLPPAIDELRNSAVQGPVVVFNVSRFRSDALLVTQNGVDSLPLPGLSLDAVLEQVRSFLTALLVTSGGVTPQARRAAEAELAKVLGWLWDHAAGPVLEALGYLRPPAPDEPWPRVWWITGGLLAHLPIHAAGHHAVPPAADARTVMDRVISSYSPTVAALHHARRRHMPTYSATSQRALIVAMPTTPGVPGRLNNVLGEARRLAARLLDSVVLVEPDAAGATDSTETASARLPDRSHPTKSKVLDLLPDCPIVHFACHGVNDLTDPSKSRLLLHDHEVDPLDITALNPLKLDNAALAYMSACETSQAMDTKLINEAVYLTSAFQVAGYRHVIGTFWNINDRVAAEIADDFYEALDTGEGQLDINKAAHALHHAMRHVRDKRPITPSLWAAHHHSGA